MPPEGAGAGAGEGDCEKTVVAKSNKTAPKMVKKNSLKVLLNVKSLVIYLAIVKGFLYVSKGLTY